MWSYGIQGSEQRHQVERRRVQRRHLSSLIADQDVPGRSSVPSRTLPEVAGPAALQAREDLPRSEGLSCEQNVLDGKQIYAENQNDSHWHRVDGSILPGQEELEQSRCDIDEPEGCHHHFDNVLPNRLQV